VAKADAPSVVQAMCKVRDRQKFGKDFHKIQLGRGGEWRREPNDESKPNGHDFH